MATHDENLENDLAPAKHLLEQGAHANRLANDLDRITKVADKGVLFPELAEDEAGVGGHDGEDEDHDDARHQAEGGHGGGKGEDAERDGLGDEDDAALPV